MTSCSKPLGMLIAGLIGSGLLVGCESGSSVFQRFYVPAGTREETPAVGVQPHGPPPQLVYSRNPDRDGGLLRQAGYVLIGTTAFNGAPDLSYKDRAAVRQGQKVGAGVVLLNVRSHSTMTSCCGPDESFVATSGGPTSYFASYWAKSDAAKTSASP